MHCIALDTNSVNFKSGLVWNMLLVSVLICLVLFLISRFQKDVDSAYLKITQIGFSGLMVQYVTVVTPLDEDLNIVLVTQIANIV